MHKVSFFYFLSVFLLLGACASTVEDADDIKNSEAYYHPIHQINSTKSFVADNENANYSDAQNDNEKVADVQANVKIESDNTSEVANNQNVPIVIENKMPDTQSLKNMMVAMILFENGSAEVDNKYISELQKVAKKAKDDNVKVLVYGYASSKTRNADFESQKIINFKMSLKRAQKVAEVLENIGVNKKNIVVEAFADAMPMLNDKMLEGERLNRRAEVYLVY